MSSMAAVAAGSSSALSSTTSILDHKLASSSRASLWSKCRTRVIPIRGNPDDLQSIGNSTPGWYAVGSYPPPPHNGMQEPKFVIGGAECSCKEQKYEDSECGGETHESLTSTATSYPTDVPQSSRKVAKESLLLLSSLKVRIADTITSGVFAFLVGMILLLDILKVLKRHQVVSICETLTGSYMFIFLISATVSSLIGCISIPLLRKLKAYQILRKEGPSTHHLTKVGTPTMGGIYFIPVGVTIAAFATGLSCPHTRAMMTATLVFGAIGLLDDILGLLKKHNYGLPGRFKLCLQVIAGACFHWWHVSSCLASPFKAKTLVLFPLPFPHLDLGSWYLPFSAFCFASMSNGVNLTDGLDGLAAGTAAAAFIGMSLAVSSNYSAIAIFGVCMAGACVGFLVHNHHKAAVFMGDTGSLALGGALAAIAASTGLFLPLLICSAIFFVETVSVILQVSYKKFTKRLSGTPKKLFRMAPIHHHFELGGIREPTIVFVAHTISCILALFGGYVGIKCLV